MESTKKYYMFVRVGLWEFRQVSFSFVPEEKMEESDLDIIRNATYGRDGIPSEIKKKIINNNALPSSGAIPMIPDVMRKNVKEVFIIEPDGGIDFFTKCSVIA